MEKDSYIDLTWEDLEDWAGTTIVSRGRTYQRNSSVSDLGITPKAHSSPMCWAARAMSRKWQSMMGT